MKYTIDNTFILKICHEINGWISIPAVYTWRGNTAGYLVMGCLYTIGLCVRSVIYLFLTVTYLLASWLAHSPKDSFTPFHSTSHFHSLTLLLMHLFINTRKLSLKFSVSQSQLTWSHCQGHSGKEQLIWCLSVWLENMPSPNMNHPWCVYVCDSISCIKSH